MSRDRSGNQRLISGLHEMGVDLFAGVNGGGIIHLTKMLSPYTQQSGCPDLPTLFTVSEYVAGFVPLGYHVATGGIGGCIATTGAATKLISSGITDAKFHNIPAVFVVGLNSTGSIGLAPLQDVSIHGAHIVPQLQAELGDSCLVVDDVTKLGSQLNQARSILLQSRPVVFACHPDVLSQNASPSLLEKVRFDGVEEDAFQHFLEDFMQRAHRHRVVLLVTDEAARNAGMRSLTTQLSERLGAPTLWTVNGSSGVSEENPYGYGHIGFGGNDAAAHIWENLEEGDVVLALGFEPGEYPLNLEPISAGMVYHLTAWRTPYGHSEENFAHHCQGGYRKVTGDLELLTNRMLEMFERKPPATDRQPVAPASLNSRSISSEARHVACVDFPEFLMRLHGSWRPGSVGFDDVCMSYKDRPYVTQRPRDAVRFYSTYHGSAMGGAFGMAVGAKLADPALNVFCFSGDGCYRLYGGALAECAHLGISLFIINNGSYAIVEQGLHKILPKVDYARYHSSLPPIDFLQAATACGWESCRVASDLSNLGQIIDRCYEPRRRSVLIEVPVDPRQEIGRNPRVERLTMQSYL
nr:thiamine pyrophosphate-dependent enzyme [Streptomyces chartreusis]